VQRRRYGDRRGGVTTVVATAATAREYDDHRRDRRARDAQPLPAGQPVNWGRHVSPHGRLGVDTTVDADTAVIM
jgi:hypothetical protein